jgi:uncharacterized protein (TIGR02598 family)
MRNRFTNRIGFTLVEVMLALAIVSIGLIAILGLLPTGLRSARDAADNTLSATIIQDVFSNIRSQPFGSVDLGNGPLNLNVTGSQILFYDSSGGQTNLAAAYYRVVVSFQAQPVPGLSFVQASVLWPAVSANPVTNVFTTYVAQYN